MIPSLDMVDCSISGAGGAAGSACFNHGGTTLLHGGNKGFLDPRIVTNHLGRRLPFDLGMEGIWILGGTVIAPNRDLLDIGVGDTSLLGQLRDGAVVIQARHRRKALGGHIGRIALGDQAVGVGRVADHEDAHICCRIGVDRLALHRKDRSIGTQQILTLHPLTARACTNQQGPVDIFESGIGIITEHHAGQQGESTVIQFHRHPIKGRQRWCDFQHVQDHWLIGAKKIAVGNPKDEGITNVAGRTCYGDTNGCFHHNLR